MANTPSWIVCEASGRWTAALRISLVRQKVGSSGDQIQEVRTLPDLTSAVQESPAAIALLEVQPDNLAASMTWFCHGWLRGNRAVALLGANVAAVEVAEALLEAGALAVIESPRHLAGAINLAGRVAVSRSTHTNKSGLTFSIAEQAWASLPWQDA
jgi:hypothetical protein